MEIQEISVDDLREYENNPRDNERAVEAVAESIREFGFKVPLVVTRENVIVCGHTRLKAAKILGIASVPCIVADDLSAEKIKAFRLADNKTGELADWDLEKLHEELKMLDAFDMDVFGFDTLPDIMDEPTDKTTDEIIDEILNNETEVKTKTGDIWLLGRHRLICGDCTKAETIKRLMDGVSADLLLTDPPYNVAVENSNGLTIENDNMSELAFYEFLKSAFSAADSAMRDGTGFYIWHGESEGLNFRKACQYAGWDLKQCLVWVKNQIVIGRQDYQWRHEPCLYGWKPGAKHYFIKNRKQATIIDDDINLDIMSEEELRSLILELIEPATVIREDKPSKNGDHPTMKPIPLIKKQVKNSTKRGGVVLDIFGGSGTTLLACEELERTCYMVELDPKYCEVIIKRWENMTGESAVLVS